METLAQKLISQHYGTSVDPSFVAIELSALVLGHAAGTLGDAHEQLYAALVAAGQIPVVGAPSHS